MQLMLLSWLLDCIEFKVNKTKKMEQTVDLRTCKPGDILISRQGTKLEYVAKTPWRDITANDHVVRYLQYPDGDPVVEETYGARTNDGFVFTDPVDRSIGNHDIVQIIHI